MDKDAVLRFRVSSGEKQVIERAAERDGLSISAWLRQIALTLARFETTMSNPKLRNGERVVTIRQSYVVEQPRKSRKPGKAVRS